jgi:autotransporter-associated beta strand protein
MTTASTRAVSSASYSRLRIALLAATSAGALLTLSSPASAASCATTAAADTCVINLGNIADIHNGLDGSDTLDFQGAPLSLSSSLFTTEATAHFIAFENAIVAVGNTLLISDTDAEAVRSLSWTIDGLLDLNFASTAAVNDTIGDASAVTVNAGGSLNLWENETIGSLAGAGDVLFVAGSPVLTTGGNGNDTVFTGTITGLGGLTKTGAGTMELNSNNTITGPLTVAGGVLEIGHAGAIDDVSSVAITGGTLSGETAYTINAPVTITTSSALSRLTGNATINGNVTSNGGLQPGNTAPDPVSLIDNPGQEMGQITINGNYTSTGSNAYVGILHRHRRRSARRRHAWHDSRSADDQRRHRGNKRHHVLARLVPAQCSRLRNDGERHPGHSRNGRQLGQQLLPGLGHERRSVPVPSEARFELLRHG